MGNRNYEKEERDGMHDSPSFIGTIVQWISAIRMQLARRLHLPFLPRDGSSGDGLAGVREPRRPRFPFRPSRAAAAEPEDALPTS